MAKQDPMAGLDEIIDRLIAYTETLPEGDLARDVFEQQVNAAIKKRNRFAKKMNKALAQQTQE